MLIIIDILSMARQTNKPNAGSMFVHRSRRLPSFKPTLGEWLCLLYVIKSASQWLVPCALERECILAVMGDDLHNVIYSGDYNTRQREARS